MLRAGTDYLFMVIGPNCWGKGRTERDAMREAKAAGLRYMPSYSVYLVPPSTRLNHMGDMVWDESEALPVILLKQVRVS